MSIKDKLKELIELYALKAKLNDYSYYSPVDKGIVFEYRQIIRNLKEIIND